MAEFCNRHGGLVDTIGPAGSKTFLTCLSPRTDVGQMRTMAGSDKKVQVKVCGRMPFSADGCKGYCPFGQPLEEDIAAKT